MTAQNRLHVLVGDEAGPDQPAVAKHEGEKPHNPRRRRLVGEDDLEKSCQSAIIGPAEQCLEGAAHPARVGAGRIRGGSFSVCELVRAINASLAERKANPKPYKWKAEGAKKPKSSAPTPPSTNPRPHELYVGN